jgi:hypothetical protein
MRLAEAQRLFAALVVRDAEIDPAIRDATLVGNGDLSAAERARIYSDMYLYRLVDALREDYPFLARLLGGDAFLALASEYVRAHPSQAPSLAHLGRHLPAFLRERPRGRADLADLAALEWARATAFIAPDAEPIDIATLGGALADNPAAAHIVLIPSVRLLSLEYDAAALWSDLEAGGDPDPPHRSATSLLIWRKGFEVFHAPVSADELASLAKVQRGATFGEACDSFAVLPEPARAAFDALASWCGEGLIAAIEA